MKYHNSLVTKIIALFVGFNLISAFVIAYFIDIETQKRFEHYAQKSLMEIAEEKRDLISSNYNQVETKAKLLGLHMEDVLKAGRTYSELPEGYFYTDGGTLLQRSKPEGVSNDDVSNVIVEVNNQNRANVIQQINETSKMDPYFKQAIQTNNVTWAYIVTKYNILRVSPYFELSSVFGEGHNQRDDIFYKTAEQRPVKDNNPVWTKPYNDYLGGGKTITCVQPIYDKSDDLYGIVCIDLSLEAMKKKFFEDFNIGQNGKIYWLNKDGTVLYGDDNGEKDIKHGKVYESNIFTGKSNISPVVRKYLKRTLESNSRTFDFVEDGKKKSLVSLPIGNSNTVLAIELNRSDLLASTEDLTTYLLIWIGINFAMAIILAIYSYVKFSKPIKGLIEDAYSISHGDYMLANRKDDKHNQDDFFEIQQLYSAFYRMANNIQEYIDSLEAQKHEMESIIDIVDETLMILDEDGQIRISSTPSSKLPLDIITVGVRKAINDGEIYTEKVKYKDSIFENKYYPIVLSDNQSPARVVVSSTDITNKVIAEREILQIEKMAGVGQLAAAIVHELKNSLALIKGATYIIDKTGACTAVEEVDLIKTAVDEAENVIDTLLDYSKRDAFGGEMVHICTVVRQILLLSKKEIIAKNIETEVDIPEELYLYSKSREALKVIMQNLIENAIQSIESDGKIKISSKKIGDEVVIKVIDSGKPIELEKIDDIFEPFVTTKKEGNGLGLWITKQLVGNMDGTIEAFQAGETVFKVIIPVKKEL